MWIDRWKHVSFAGKNGWRLRATWKYCRARWGLAEHLRGLVARIERAIEWLEETKRPLVVYDDRPGGPLLNELRQAVEERQCRQS